mmetsp:Transcript_33071/g.78328  ORF Transcript_33071/g.78328 Transcript_33071/m.78328 type:complete len:238 (-) Transcript_33071:4727-5440(-)
MRMRVGLTRPLADPKSTTTSEMSDTTEKPSSHITIDVPPSDDPANGAAFCTRAVTVEKVKGKTRGAMPEPTACRDTCMSPAWSGAGSMMDTETSASSVRGSTHTEAVSAGMRAVPLMIVAVNPPESGRSRPDSLTRTVTPAPTLLLEGYTDAISIVRARTTVVTGIARTKPADMTLMVVVTLAPTVPAHMCWNATAVADHVEDTCAGLATDGTKEKEEAGFGSMFPRVTCDVTSSFR